MRCGCTIKLYCFVFFVLLPSLCASACPIGDLDLNCEVGLNDLRLFVLAWQGYPDCFGAPGCPDLGGNAQVNVIDLGIISQHWQEKVLATLVINEIMASNNTTIVDPDEPGEYPDWFEIYNYGSATWNMGGMYIEDQTNHWDVPPGVSIAPGEHKIFWADKDYDIGQGNYHTNFKLSATSDELSLYDTDGTLLDSKAFSSQTSDISFGRYPDAADDWYLMGAATPGAANTAGLSGKVYFSRLGGTFTSTFSLELSTSSATATIRYTTDGSIPTVLSTVYSAPISINNAQARVVRANAYDSPLASGPVHTEMYIPLAGDVLSVSSNLPIVVIDSFGEDIDNNGTSPSGCWDFTYPYQRVAAVFIDTDKTGQASIDDLADFSGRAGMRIRGESSRCWGKRQYSFEIWDEINGVDKKVSLLDLPLESDWVLNAPFSDKTHLRNVLIYKWYNDIGQYAPRTRFFELYFNAGGGKVSAADYRGVYVLMEKIKVSDERVDISTLDPGDSTIPDITGGYIIRHDKDNGQEIFTTIANMTGDFQYSDPDEFALTLTQKNWLKSWLDEFESTLNGSNFDNPVSGYAKYVDTDEFIKYDLLLELQKNADGLKLSTYMHKDRNGKLAMGPIWDCNLSLGNTWMPDWWFPDWFSMASTTNEGWFNDNFTYAWYNRMLQDDDYMLRYADEWFSYRETVISDASIEADFDYYYDLLDSDGPAVNTGSTPIDRNYAKWNINQILPGNLSALGSFDAEVEWLKTWIYGNGTAKGTYSDRLQWVDELWESDRSICSPPTLSINASPMDLGAQVNINDDLTMIASCAGTIYYTNDGTDPRTWATVSGSASFNTTLIAENAAKAVLVPSGSVNNNWKGGGAFNDSSWNSYTFVPGMVGGVGYENFSGYGPLISYDVISQMLDINATCYIRVAFTVDAVELGDFEYLTLRIRLDDAFVAFINGTEVARSSLAPTGALTWNSSATNYLTDSTSFIEYDLTPYIGTLSAGSGNILAIHGLNSSVGSSDTLFSFELEGGAGGSGVTPGGAISPSAIPYTGSINLTESMFIKARSKNGSNWSALNKAKFSMNNVAPSLRITEVMYHPVDPNDEFIEVTNTGVSSINLAWAEFTDGVDFTFPSWTLTPGDHALVVRDQLEFIKHYPSAAAKVVGEYTNDALSNGGEEIVLRDAGGVEIHDFDYKDGWYPITDGHGFSLNIINPAAPDLSTWDDKDAWQASNVVGGSPGTAYAANVQPNGAVIINEILTHSNSAPNDWIELKNTTAGTINIGGWFLSDDLSNLQKYEIAAGATISAGGYVYFTQDANFGNLAPDPGRHTGFGLSELGEEVYLSSGSGAVLSGGYSIKETFGAAEWDRTFGPHTKSAAAEYDVDFVSVSTPTMGYVNAAVFVEDVVINEIMYNPSLLPDETGEYIELVNRGGGTVLLYDSANPSNTWKFTKGISYTFPTGVSMTSGEKILVVRTLAAAFRTANGVSGGVQVFGPYEDAGKLANDGEKIELSKPGDPEPGSGFVPYIRVEQVNYSDGAHPLVGDPWPITPDGGGDSLNRKVLLGNYGNDVDNWQSSIPTPGS